MIADAAVSSSYALGGRAGRAKLLVVEDAEQRRAQRAKTWKTTVVRDNVFEAMALENVRDHAAMSPAERMALCWQLSEEQYAMNGVVADVPRLPRSFFRVHRR